MVWVTKGTVTAADLGLPSSGLLRLLLFLLLLVNFFLLFGGALLWLLFLDIIVRLLGSRRNVLLSYVADFPGSLELLLILFLETLETVKVFDVLKGFLGVLDDLGSDTTPMTPYTAVGNVRLINWLGAAYTRDAYNEVLPLKSTTDL